MRKNPGTSLVVQWLRLCASTAGGTGSIPGQGTKNPECHLAASQKKIFFFQKWKKEKEPNLNFGLKQNKQSNPTNYMFTKRVTILSISSSGSYESLKWTDSHKVPF